MQQPDPSSRMGKGMIILAWLIGLGLLTMAFDWQLGQQANPNQQPESQLTNAGAEVKLRQNRQGHYVVSGTVNAQPVVFLLDTGATRVSVPAHLADDLGLIPGRTQLAQTANGTVKVAQTQIDQLAIGDIRLQDVRASINPGMRSNQILLGMSALKQLEFTQRGEWLILRNLN